MNHLVLQVLLSFIIAGTWIAAATFLAERFGSLIGGLITNAPSNIVVSLIFISMLNSDKYVLETAASIPAGLAVTTLFLFIFIATVKRGLGIAVIFSLSIWILTAWLSSFIFQDHILINLLIYSVVTIVCFLISIFFKIQSAAKSDKNYSPQALVVRAVFAGSMVASVVLVSAFAPPLITGIFATFPAVILSSMVILTINQNADFARATGKVMLLSTSNITVYVLIFYFIFPGNGLVMATVFSFISAIIWLAILQPVLKRIT